MQPWPLDLQELVQSQGKVWPTLSSESLLSDKGSLELDYL